MVVALLFLLAQAPRETPAARPAERVLIKAAHLIDGRSDSTRDGLAVLVEGDRIAKVGRAAELQAPGIKVIDLGNAWLLPGLIDAHTHLLLKESIPYRTLRGAAAARIALMNGFTTLRDLGTEGAMYADADLKTAIARGVVPGPRLFVSTLAMAPPGCIRSPGIS
jgi:imidazolonepropionase-like amidohydrolase